MKGRQLAPFGHRSVHRAIAGLGIRPSAIRDALLLIGCATLLSCNKEPKAVSAAYLMVLPREVQVSVGSSGVSDPLRLEAVSQSAVGNPKDPGPLTWSSSPVGATFVQEDNEAVVSLPTSLPAGTVVTVTATNGTLSGTSSIAIIDISGSALDEVQSEHVAGEIPDVSLASGQSASSCEFDAITAFVSAAPIGPWIGTSECGRSEAAVFSSAWRPFIAEKMDWTSGPDLVDATSNAKPLDIPLRVVIGVPTPDAADSDLINRGLLLASETYFRMRVGVTFPPSLQTTIVQSLPVAFDNCGETDLLSAEVQPDPTQLNIYLVSAVAGAARGVFCEPNVLLISRTALVTTFSHELSHAFGLVAQDFGHTDLVHGFNSDNVMSGTAGSGPGEDMRFRLTLGQLYRIHRDGRSWLNRAADGTAGPFLCPCDPYAKSSCPALSTDLRPVVGAPATPFPAGLCP